MQNIVFVDNSGVKPWEIPTELKDKFVPDDYEMRAQSVCARLFRRVNLEDAWSRFSDYFFHRMVAVERNGPSEEDFVMLRLAVVLAYDLETFMRIVFARVLQNDGPCSTGLTSDRPRLELAVAALIVHAQHSNDGRAREALEDLADSVHQISLMEDTRPNFIWGDDSVTQAMRRALYHAFRLDWKRTLH